MTRPPHHRPDGTYQNPWTMAAGDEALRRSVWRLALQAIFGRRPPNPPDGALPAVEPALAGVDGEPDVGEGGVRVTWIGHATALIQLPGLNILTDPVWSDRCSPVGFMGPRRFVAPPLALEDLPPIHAVLLSHDHYDHLDRPTVRALHRRFGAALSWFVPLGLATWLAKLGITHVVERDWWETAALPGGRFEVVATPARHWTRRRPGGTNRRLWCGWVVRPARAPGGAAAARRARAAGSGPADAARRPAKAAPRVYFAGDSGYCPAFREVGERLGPFDVTLMPIGAYEPRWFMGAAHMNPEEAVQAYRDAGGEGAFMGIHWGTWRLTFEDPLEPPARARAAWADAALPGSDLYLLRHGETLRLP